jgi:PleD family two-component response regulator
MNSMTYDLFKGSSQENAMWIETVQGLDAATERMKCLAAATSSDCFLFQSGHIVATATNPNPPAPEIAHTPRIIVLSSNPDRAGALAEILKQQQIEPTCAVTVKQYREILLKRGFDVVFCDSRLTDGDYRDVINVARSADPQARIVLTSRLANWPEFLEAMRAGAFDVISTPCHAKDVEWVIMQAKRDARIAKQLKSSAYMNSARRASA